MKPFFAVQATDRHDTEIHKTVDALKSLGLEYETFGTIYFEDEITNLEAFPTDRPVIPICGTKVLSLHLRGLTPPNWQMFYDRDEFDQAQYSDVYQDYLLNYGAEYSPFVLIADQVQTSARFMKPSDDGKAFAGLIVEEGQTLRDALKSQMTQRLVDTDLVLSAPLQRLGREWRMFVVNDEVIDISEYRDRGHVQAKVTEEKTKNMLRCMFRSVLKLSSRKVSTYVMDVAEVFPYSHLETPEKSGREFRIVEINCFNCSGLYKVDVAKVYGAVAQMFED